MAEDRLPPAVRTLIVAGVKLARSTTSGRVAFAHAHAVVDPAAVPEPLREPIRRELDAAAAAVTPLDAKAVAKALKEAWGRDQGKVVDDLDPATPLAVTPGAQTHRATLDGEPVVVKILRPGLRESIRSDLALLETLTGPAGAAFPAVDAGAIVREVRERIMDELDLEHEAAQQRSASRALRRTDGITVPAPVTDLSEEGVLVAAFVEGPTLAGGMPASADAGAILRALVRAAVGLPRTAGIVHADLEPGNVVVTGADTIALVDFGASARADLERLDVALDGLEAIRANDEAAFTKAALGLGALPDAATCATALPLLREVAGDLITGPAVLDADALIAVAARAEGSIDELFALAMKATLDPRDLWPLRMAGTLIATLARFGVQEDWVALALTAGREGC